MADADQIGILSLGVEESKQEDIYIKALQKVNQELQKKEQTIDTCSPNYGKNENHDELDEYCDDLLSYLDQEMKQGSDYTTEYEEVISLISQVCNTITLNAKKPDSVPINEEVVIELCPRMWALAVEYQMTTVEEKQRCFLETLLKGAFSLLAIKSPRVALKVSACNLQIFF